MSAFYTSIKLILFFTVVLTGVNNLNAQDASDTTVWNGTTWSNGLPTINKDVVISGNLTCTENITAKRLTVNNNATVTLVEVTSLTVENEITVVQNSSLTIDNNASLVQLNDMAVNQGNIVVKRNSSSLYRLDYTLWSSPVSGQNLLSFSPQTQANRFYEYAHTTDASGNNVEQYFNIDASVNNFVAGKSYLIRMPNTDAAAGYDQGTSAITFKGSFTGTPNNGVITRPLAVTGERFTTVGNPYPSPINIKDFYSANATVLDAGAALYFWRKKNNTNAGSYVTITQDAYVYNQTEGGAFGGEQWDELFNVNTSEEDWVINAGQGFIVKTAAGLANPVLTFNNSMRRGNVHNNQFFRTAQPNDALKSRLWLNISGNGAFSQTAIVYSNTATLGIDYGRDGKQITSGAVSLYSVVNNTNLAIQARPDFNSNDIVPIGFSVSVGGTYTINRYRADGIFDNGQEVYIKDNAIGILHNLSAPYTFNTTAGTFNNRFEIVYTQQSLDVNTVIAEKSDVNVYQTLNI